MDRPRTVRDTIPSSRLASYGVQAVYDEERERLYTSDEAICPLPPVDPAISDEPWLMAAVEDIFKRLTTFPERFLTNCSLGRSA